MAICIGTVCIRAPAVLGVDSAPGPLLLLAVTLATTKASNGKLNGAMIKTESVTSQLTAAITDA